jgi:hypothetical protein
MVPAERKLARFRPVKLHALVRRPRLPISSWARWQGESEPERQPNCTCHEAGGPQHNGRQELRAVSFQSGNKNTAHANSTPSWRWAVPPALMTPQASQPRRKTLPKVGAAIRNRQLARDLPSLGGRPLLRTPSIMVEVEAVAVHIGDGELPQSPRLLLQRLNDVCS